MGDEALRLFGNLLRMNVAVGTDTAMFTALPGNSSEAQGADRTWAGVCEDFDEGLRLLNMGTGSRPFIIMTPENAKSLAVQAMTVGVDSLNWNGGSFAGATVVVSDAQDPDRVTFLDAASLAVALGDIELRRSTEANYELDTAPTQQSKAVVGATATVSAFQTNTTLLMVLRRVAFKAVRGSAYHHLTGFGLGETSGSPAGT